MQGEFTMFARENKAKARRIFISIKLKENAHEHNMYTTWFNNNNIQKENNCMKLTQIMRTHRCTIIINYLNASTESKIYETQIK